MRIRFALLSLGAALAPLAVSACDLCGCFMGLTPYDNQSSVTWLHRYRAYHGYSGQPHDVMPTGAPGLLRVEHDGHDHGTTAPDPTDFEIYRVDELRARWFLTKRLEVSAYVPMVRNVSQENGSQTSVTGLGDVSVLIGYHVLRQIETEGVQQRLILGAGAKLPTGASNRRSAEGIRYELPHQPGTGTLDPLLYATYVMGYRRVGLSLTTSGKISARNSFGESLAPALTQYVTLFYTLPVGDDWRIIPSAQLYYERTKGQRQDGVLTGEHALNEAMLGPGVDVFWRNLSLAASGQLPVYRHSDPNHTVSAGRIVLGLTYSFRQTKYLFGS
jgi:hypothetical protein